MRPPADRRHAVLSAVLDIVDHHGLEQATIRLVAERAGVSIGTVQHYFATKDELLEAAYREATDRIRSRLRALDPEAPPRDLVAATLRELLPLDARRATEGRLHLAFMARAAVAPALAAVNTAIMGEVHAALRGALAGLEQVGPDAAPATATALLALADGLAAHTLATSPASADRAAAALDLVLTELLGPSSAPLRPRR